MTRRCVRGRNFPQFDGTALQARNCAVSVGRALVHFGSRGKYAPSAPVMRKRAGGTNAWWTPSDVKMAVESYDAEMRKIGYKPLRYKMAGSMSGNLYTSGASRTNLIARVKRLEMVHVVTDYAITNDQFPALSGSSGFRSRHAIWIGGGTKGKPGWRKRGGVLEVRIADSTWGRAGAPKAAPKWVRFSKVWKMADGAWSTRGGRGWVGGSVACAAPLKTKPPVEPPDPCEDVKEQAAALAERLEEAQEQLVEAQELIEVLRDKRLPRALVDRLVALTDEIDAATPVIPGSDPVEEGVEVPE